MPGDFAESALCEPGETVKKLSGYRHGKERNNQREIITGI
jgi:hypothetical protein